MLPKKCQSEGLKKVKKGDGEICHRKGGFLKKGGLNLCAIYLQENHEMEEFYFSLSHYSIIDHFLIFFKR